ncbi:MAG: hypothetical protein SNI51_04945 [Rikenellaceae bacterium]
MGLFGLFDKKSKLEDLKIRLKHAQDEKKRITSSSMWANSIKNASSPAAKKRAQEQKATLLRNAQRKIDNIKKEIANCKK